MKGTNQRSGVGYALRLSRLKVVTFVAVGGSGFGLRASALSFDWLTPFVGESQKNGQQQKKDDAALLLHNNCGLCEGTCDKNQLFDKKIY